MSRELATRGEPPIVALLDKSKDALERALPKHLNITRMSRILLTAIRTTPKLANCDPYSTLAAFFEAAQLGLEPCTPLGQAWVLPYGNKAGLVIGYKGYIALADRAGVMIRAEVVWSDDFFEYGLGTEPYIHHKKAEEPAAQRTLTHAYAVAVYPDGRKNFKVVDQSEIGKAKGCSPSSRSKDSPWRTHEESMWMKTAVRRLAPFLPLSAEFQRAVMIEEASEGVKHKIDWKLDEVLDELPATSQASVAEAAVEAAAAIPNGDPQVQDGDDSREQADALFGDDDERDKLVKQAKALTRLKKATQTKIMDEFVDLSDKDLSEWPLDDLKDFVKAIKEA